MQLGVGPFTCQRRPDDDRSMRSIYGEMLDLVGVAEDVGLDSVWLSEHHFVDDGYLPGMMPSLGALAGATDDIAFGSCVALAPFYDSVRLAEDAATLELLSEGRFVLGLGIGYRDEEFESFDVPKAQRPRRIEEAIRVLRGAWTEGPLEYDPEFHGIDPDVTVTPKPERPPPIVLAGNATASIRRAARMAEGWCPPPRLSPEEIRSRTEEIESVREEEGVTREFTVYPGARGFVADSTREAWDAFEEGYLYLERKYAEFFDRELPPDFEERAKERALVGTPQEVIERLEAFEEAAGPDSHFVFRTFPPGVDADAARRCLELLGDEVAPALRQ